MKDRWMLGLGLLVGFLSVLAAGCAGGTGKAPVVQVAVAQAAVQRIDQPQVAENDLAALASGNSAFAFDLYGALRQQEGNLFYSP